MDFMELFKTWLKENYGPDNFQFNERNLYGKQKVALLNNKN